MTDNSMDIQVLVATMEQEGHKILQDMNIQSDAIIGNQSDINEIETFHYNGNKIKYLTFSERGVGLNRNNALMRADGDICLIADDDMVFMDDYPKVVKNYYKKIPEADVIIFNLIEDPPKRHINKEIKRVRFYNFMKYGAARFSFKRESVTKKSIFFNLHFGGGAEYSAGEDVLFLHSCLKNGLKVYAVPVAVAKLTEARKSTWFEGVNEKFFYDKGVLYSQISKPLSKVLSLRYAIKHRTTYRDEMSFIEALKAMIRGTDAWK